MLAWGCRQAPATSAVLSHVPQLLEPKADTGLALRAMLLRDTVAVGDPAAVEILYAIINGSRPTAFDNHPGRYRIEVTGPDGQPARSLGGAGPASGAMERFEVLLPAGSSLVQRQDLRCVNDAAYSQTPISPSKDDCLAKYALAIPGLYRVVVQYFGPALDDSAVASQGSSSAGGVHLADTATFVIKDE